MKKVWDIFKIDWRRISRSKAAILLVVALMILPSLYAWFNIKALWDPYGNTGGIEIAVSNDDAGTTINDEKINVGNEIIEKLKDNENLGWRFVSKKKADKGVKYGDYYASLYIPEDFSENLSSVLTNNPEKAEIVFTVNDKINAITPKITTTGATTITNQVREEFVGTVSEALLLAFNEIGIALKEDLPTIRNLEDKLYKLQQALPKIKEFGQQVVKLEGDLPTIQEKANKIVDLPQYIPEINKVGEGVLKVEEALPTLEAVGDKIVFLQGQIPQIRESAEKLGEFQNHFDSATAVLTDAINQANKAIDVIEAVQEQLPKIEQITTNSGEYVAVVEDFVAKMNGSFDTIADALKLNITIVNSTSNSTVKVLETMLNQTDSTRTTAQLQQLLNQQAALLSVQSDHLQALLNSGHGDSAALQSLLQKTTTAQNQVNSLSSKLQSNNIQDMYYQAVKVQQTTSNLLNNFDGTYLPAVKNMLSNMQTDLQTAENVIQEAQKQLPNISGLLTSTSDMITNAKTTLQSYEDSLPALTEKVQTATNYINENLDSVINGIDTAASFYSDHFAEVEAGIHKGSDFVQNELPGLESELERASKLVEEKMPKVVEAVETASSLAQSQLPQLVKTINNAAGKLTEMKENITLEEVIDILRRDVQTDSDFLSDPIKLKENMLFPIANYGSASSPFYTSLAIWVGALLLVSMLSVDVEMPKKIYKPHHFYFGRGLTFLAIALVQATIVSVGDIFLLGVDVHDRTAFVLFSLLICFVFTTIVYTLVAIFGNIGKGGAIILLVLQISSSGGNFPIEVSSSFFQHLYPFLPFTYAVNLLREGVGGVIWQNAIQYIAMLLIFAALFIIIGTILKKPLMDAVEAFTKNAKKSKIFH